MYKSERVKKLETEHGHRVFRIAGPFVLADVYIRKEDNGLRILLDVGYCAKKMFLSFEDIERAGIVDLKSLKQYLAEEVNRSWPPPPYRKYGVN